MKASSFHHRIFIFWDHVNLVCYTFIHFVLLGLANFHSIFNSFQFGINVHVCISSEALSLQLGKQTKMPLKSFKCPLSPYIMLKIVFHWTTHSWCWFSQTFVFLLRKSKLQLLLCMAKKERINWELLSVYSTQSSSRHDLKSPDKWPIIAQNRLYSI